LRASATLASSLPAAAAATKLECNEESHTELTATARPARHSNSNNSRTAGGCHHDSIDQRFEVDYLFLFAMHV